MFHESCKNASKLAPPVQLLMAHCQKWSRADHRALTMNFNWRHSSRVIKILRLEAGRCTVSSLCVWPWPLGLIVARQDLVQSTEAILKIRFEGSISLAAQADLSCCNLGSRENGGAERRWSRRNEEERKRLRLSLLISLSHLSGPQIPISESLFGWIQMMREPRKLFHPVNGLCVWPWSFWPIVAAPGFSHAQSTEVITDGIS